MQPDMIILLSIGIAIGALASFLMNFILRRPVAITSAVPQFSEKDVESLLKKSGYSILGKKQRETVITAIDGKEHFGYIEADYTVKKNKKRYAVVVKIGEGPDDPNEPGLRRKLIEYARVFRVAGVLFVSPGLGHINVVTFHFPHEHNIDFFFRFLIGLFIILMVVGIIWLLVQLKLF